MAKRLKFINRGNLKGGKVQGTSKGGAKPFNRTKAAVRASIRLSNPRATARQRGAAGRAAGVGGGEG